MDNPSTDEILTGIYALLLNIRDYEYFNLRVKDEHFAEWVREKHAAGLFVLDEVSLVRPGDES